METPNLSYINSLSGGDEGFKRKLLEILKKEFPEEKETYFKNLSEKNLKLAADNVHKLKHKISILGLEKSYDIAVNFEDNLLEDRIDLKDDFEAVLKLITEYLEKL